MKRLLFLTLLISSKAFSIDFRTLDLGQSCTNVVEMEKKLGTEHIQWSGSPEERIAFKGTVFGVDTSILYFCPGGVLFTGNYSFQSENLNEASKLYRKLYDQLITTYGVPRLDPTPWQKNADPRWVTPDPGKYITWWQNDRLDITLSIHETDQAKGIWGVFITIGHNKH